VTVSVDDVRSPTDGASPAPNGRGAARASRLGWGKGLLLSLAGVFAVLTGLGFYGDFADVSSALASFRWSLIPALLALTAANYLVRYLRWRKLLRLTIRERVSLTRDLLIFFAGTAMILTPGRAGEWIKSYYLRDLYGVPVARTAPIVLVERISDSLVMLLLAATGLFLFGRGEVLFAVVAVLIAVAIFGLRHRRFVSLVSSAVRRLSPTRGLAPPIQEFHQSSRDLLSPSGLAWSCGLGTIIWALECLTFFLVLVGLGRAMTWELLAQAAFIFPVATLAGSLSMLPGGIGVTEGSITGMTQAILGASRSVAAASALLVRAVILGFGVALGLMALALLSLPRTGWEGLRAPRLAPTGVPPSPPVDGYSRPSPR
jgi:uncharacterized protein (TIRG00374 family)